MSNYDEPSGSDYISVGSTFFSEDEKAKIVRKTERTYKVWAC